MILGIDKVDFEQQIKTKASLLLGEGASIDKLTEENFKYFSKEAQRIANACVEKYVFAIFDHYSSGDFAIKDAKLLIDFTDFNKGYQAQILKWIDENKLEVKEVKIELPNEPVKGNTKPMIEGVESHILSSIGGGLALTACALVIFECKTWLILTASIISAIASIGGGCLSKSEKTARENEKKWEVENGKYMEDIRSMRDELVRGVINDLKGWLDKAQEESERILAQFGINRSVSKL